MAKTKSLFICQNCEATFKKWQGKCDKCDSWNSITESDLSHNKTKKAGKVASINEIGKNKKSFRKKVGLGEFDRVLGGGVVDGSLILLSGDPGVGKSTLALQVASLMSRKEKIIYASGEESQGQIASRAQRLKIEENNLFVLSETNTENIILSAQNQKPGLLIVDSIQTIYSEESMNAPGSISQVLSCTQMLLSFAKKNNIPVIIIGHVTKDGNISGPKTLEHLVDTVLYFEGKRDASFRILKTSKNRFGPTDEVGVFEMTKKGLMEIKSPSEFLLSEKGEVLSGSVVFGAIEGTRSFLIEVQALTSSSSFGYPKRTASGMDFNRLQLLIAAISKKTRVNLSNQDVYVNIVGGVVIKEPALDLPLCAAIISAYKNKAIGDKTLILGEIGLAGEVRKVNNIESRVKEAEKTGFNKIILPASQTEVKTKMKKIGIKRIKELEEII